MTSINFAPMLDTAGFEGICLVDGTSGMIVGSKVNGIANMAAAASFATTVYRAKRATVKSMKTDQCIEDIVFILPEQIHMLRPLTKNQNFFLFLIVNKDEGNLGMSRVDLEEFERNLQFN